MGSGGPCLDNLAGDREREIDKLHRYYSDQLSELVDIIDVIRGDLPAEDWEPGLTDEQVEKVWAILDGEHE